ncbi:MAG: hypothetical protein H8E44_01280 [Planctomycetes bacterium]|nr:hypothetical protein [Planctomycetota bacterium]
MIARACSHENRKKNGKSANGQQRYKCKDCGARFTDNTLILNGMRVDPYRCEMIIKCLCEGMSIRATSRLTDTDPHTVIDLLVMIGERCKRFLEQEIREIHVDDIQVDEVWQFVFCKDKTRKKKGYGEDTGDSWCFTAVERNTKLVVAWHFGKRSQANADLFCERLRDATTGHYQISTDGYAPYRTAVPVLLGGRVGFGMLIKIFGEAPKDEQRKYSLAKIKAIRKEKISGNPDMGRICTSHTERANGTMRTFIKRMGRLTYCFSKLWDNHEAMLGLYFAHYNFCRVHGTLKTTLAVATGLASRPWTVRELIEQTSTF